MLRFGTDGVRGVANADLTPELVLALGRAAARVLGSTRFVVGRDTRWSGPLVEAALCAGLAAEGADVDRVGVVPTPGVAWLSAADGVPGAVISASHNPFPDNGVKLFAPGGRKLPDAVEEEIERHLHELLAGGSRRADVPVGDAVGRVADRPEAVERWTAAVVESLDGRRLDGLSVVVDCANGAASAAAPAVLRRLGAEVTAIHDDPDGRNVNDGCGSTDPRDLCRAVVATGAAAGLAFDGDADRVVAVDGDGRVVDGDHVIAMCAVDLRDRGRLSDDTVVVTVMSNLGFRLAMAEQGIRVVETAVGDRYVLEALEGGGWSLGGEQSGHVVFRDLATTGDGLLTGVQVLDLVVRSGRPLADLAAGAMTRLPQVLRNVGVADRRPTIADEVAGDVAAVEAELGERGRVLIRPSGTEPVVRVMVEAERAEVAEAAADRLVDAVRRVAAGA